MARPKGSQNRVSGTAKAALLQAFEQKGGVPALLKWAKENETDFYRLWGKLIPTEVSGIDGEAIKIAVQVWQFGDKKVSF